MRFLKLTSVASSEILCITLQRTAPTTKYANNKPAGPEVAYAEPAPMNNPVPIPLQRPIQVMWYPFKRRCVGPSPPLLSTGFSSSLRCAASNGGALSIASSECLGAIFNSNQYNNSKERYSSKECANSNVIADPLVVVFIKEFIPKYGGELEKLESPIAQFEVFTASVRCPLELGGDGEDYGAECGTLVESSLVWAVLLV